MDRTANILSHMLEDACEAIDFAGQAGSYNEFANSPLYRKAIIMSIINIGELAKRLPDEFKIENNHIPWKNISGMRDIAAHGYHIMDDEIVWDVVTHSIPELLDFLKNYLGE